jgi:hypothetical protein
MEIKNFKYVWVVLESAVFSSPLQCLVLAVFSPVQSSSQRLEHRRMSRSAAISTVRNQS